MTVCNKMEMDGHQALRRIPCPCCGTLALSAQLQCDYYPDGCLWVARCDACQAQYHLNYRSGPGRVAGAPTIEPTGPTSTEHAECA